MFYTFDQNNSGGSFDIDDKVSTYVIIEAKDANQANHLAESIGIYFDGVRDGQDCPCCGDRWHSKWGDGTEVPMIYGSKVEDCGEDQNRWVSSDEPWCYVYYLDGTVKKY